MRVHALTFFSFTDLKYINEIRKITGVSNAEGRLWGYYYDPLFKANYTLLAPPEFVYQQGEIGIGQGVSRSAVTEEGNAMPFFGIDGKLTSFRIRELLSSESELVTSDLVIMSEQDFRALFAGVISGLAVGLLQPFAKVSSMRSFVPGIQKRLLLIALASYVGFFLLAVYTMTTSVLRM